MLRIYKTIVKEKRIHTLAGGKHYSSVYHRKTWLKEIKTDKQVVDTIERTSVYHYTLEDEETGKLFLLKVDEGDIGLNDVLYVGERNNKISTYSKTNLDGGVAEESDGNTVQTVSSFKRIEAKTIVMAVVAFIGFLIPFVSTFMNFYLAFKHDYESTIKDHREVSIKLVRGVCAVCAIMPVFFTVKLMLVRNVLSLSTFISSSMTWGFISALVVVGGSLYIQLEKEKDIENFANKVK
jgi:hypothetical protein